MTYTFSELCTILGEPECIAKRIVGEDRGDAMYYDLSQRPQEDSPAIILGCAGEVRKLRTTQFSCVAAEVSPGVFRLQQICNHHAALFRSVKTL